MLCCKRRINKVEISNIFQLLTSKNGNIRVTLRSSVIATAHRHSMHVKVQTSSRSVGWEPLAMVQVESKVHVYSWVNHSSKQLIIINVQLIFHISQRLHILYSYKYSKLLYCDVWPNFNFQRLLETGDSCMDEIIIKQKVYYFTGRVIFFRTLFAWLLLYFSSNNCNSNSFESRFLRRFWVISYRRSKALFVTASINGLGSILRMLGTDYSGTQYVPYELLREE